MKIVSLGKWIDEEKALYGGEYGLVISCANETELKKLCTPEVKKILFTEADLEIKVKESINQSEKA